MLVVRRDGQPGATRGSYHTPKPTHIYMCIYIYNILPPPVSFSLTVTPPQRKTSLASLQELASARPAGMSTWPRHAGHGGHGRLLAPGWWTVTHSAGLSWELAQKRCWCGWPGRTQPGAHAGRTPRRPRKTRGGPVLGTRRRPLRVSARPGVTRTRARLAGGRDEGTSRRLGT
jgi:hypothetical protein